MSNYTDSSKRLVAFLKERPWLFTDSPYLSMDRYVKYFEYGHPSEFHIFPTMLPYKASIIDEFKGKVYNTMFLPVSGPNSLGMHTVIQLNRNFHVVFMWANSEDHHETIVYATIHTSDSFEYVKFLSEYEKFVYTENNHSGFFNQAPN